MKKLLILISLFFASPIFAQDVMKALQALDGLHIEKTHYRETKYNGDKIEYIAIFNPKKEAALRWTLESFKGRQANDEELKKFREKKANNTDDLWGQNIDEKSLIALDSDISLTLRRWRFKMKNNADLNGINPKYIAGEVMLNAQGDAVKLNIKNTDTFRVKLLMKVLKLDSQLEFTKHTNGMMIPTNEKMEMVMSMAGIDANIKSVKKFEVIPD